MSPRNLASQKLPRQFQRASDVHIHHLIEICNVRLLEGLLHGIAGVVHHDIDRAVLLFDLSGESLN
jgi:hypothetical protein